MTENEYRIEQFTLTPDEFPALAKLITESFLNEELTEQEGGTILFDEQTFNIIFGSPIISRDFFVRAIYVPTNEIVGFLGAIPRKVNMKGKILNYVIPALAAVHYKHRRHGLALKMGIKLREIGIEKDVDGGFSLHEPEQHGIDTSKAVARDTNLPIEEFALIRQFVVRSLDTPKVASVIKLKWYEKLAFRLLQSVPKNKNPRIRKYDPNDGEQMFTMMQDHIDRNEVSLVRDKEDFFWYLQQPGVNCVVHEDENGTVQGFILAWRMKLAGFGNAVPFGWLDLVHTHRLTINEAKDLANYLCITSKELGWAGLQTPFIPYFDSAPFKKAKFIFYPKKISIDIFNLKKLDLPKNVKSFYFDWR
ncbi:MAG: hypothetical protein E4G98_02635 [Promethearchaeota archaeon]|nr:MAG: hypothetical protein E4G98_02635 [Candidatus Lokiarchaeota archaeon]